MTILDEIIAHKKQEVSQKKRAIPVGRLEQSYLFDRDVYSLSVALRTSSTGIIAEHKRKSPSKSDINMSAVLKDVVCGYQKAGVSGISILTDTKYFGGSLEDLILARANTKTPLLRKEFIVDSYQIFEAKAYGADAILLIAAALSEEELKSLSQTAKHIGLDVLLEVHNREELEKSLLPSVDMLGVNNRNLKTFDVTLDTSKDLAQFIPNDFVKVSESGINTGKDVLALREYGYQGFLIGERFMRSEDPGASAERFITELI